MKGNQNANMSRGEYNNVTSKQNANTAYNGNELYDKGIVRGKIFILPEEMREERLTVEVREGYIFKDENGNVINATKIVLEKKKKEYPKSYAECCCIIGALQTRHYFYTKKDAEKDYPHEVRILRKLDYLKDLLICRDAYWKIAGEEMGLGKPWKPDWLDDDTKKYIITSSKVFETFGGLGYINYILTFPTREMRDVFYENFKELIEECKELL